MSTIKVNLASAKRAKAKLAALENDLSRAKASIGALQAQLDLAAMHVQVLHRTIDLVEKVMFEETEDAPSKSPIETAHSRSTPAQSAWMRPKEVAKFLSVSSGTVYRWVKDIPDFPKPSKLGSQTTVFSREAIEQYVRRLSSSAK